MPVLDRIERALVEFERQENQQFPCARKVIDDLKEVTPSALFTIFDALGKVPNRDPNMENLYKAFATLWAESILDPAVMDQSEQGTPFYQPRKT